MPSTVTDKGQVTLPEAIRDKPGIDPGTCIEFELQPDDNALLRLVVGDDPVQTRKSPP